ncbi:MAG: hypothetical protein IT423_16960 [Pirellulaceae bacterium]|nr:hypothetical protein [Pirellulaceae bacterium]
MLKVFGAHTLGNLVTLADRFLLLPVMLSVWGPKVTGVWLTIRSLPAVLSVGELGFASATGNVMTDRVASQDWPAASRVYWATSRLINTLSLICLLATLLATLGLPLSDWLKGQALASWEFNLAVLLMALYTVSIFQTQLYYAGYRSINQQATAAFGIHGVRVAELILVVLALIFWPNVWAVASAYVIARLTGALALRWNLLRQAAWLSKHRQSDWSEIRPLIKPALGFAGLPLAQTFQLQGSTLAVAAATSPEMVAAFTAMRTLARFPIQFCAALGRTTWPELSQALAKKEYGSVLGLHKRMMWLSLIFAVGSIVGLLTLGNWVYGLWTSSRLEFSFETFAILSITAGLTAYSTNAMNVLNALSLHGRASAWWVTLALLSVAITVAIPNWLGMVGISGVLLVCDILVLVYVLYATGEQIHRLKSAEPRS